MSLILKDAEEPKEIPMSSLEIGDMAIVTDRSDRHGHIVICLGDVADTFTGVYSKRIYDLSQTTGGGWWTHACPLLVRKLTKGMIFEFS